MSALPESQSRGGFQDSLRSQDLQALVSTSELHRMVESLQRDQGLDRSRSWRTDAPQVGDPGRSNASFPVPRAASGRHRLL